jgi:DNA modification methylase
MTNGLQGMTFETRKVRNNVGKVAAILHHGECLEVMASLPDKCFDAIICDPPYG